MYTENDNVNEKILNFVAGFSVLARFEKDVIVKPIILYKYYKVTCV